MIKMMRMTLHTRNIVVPIARNTKLVKDIFLRVLTSEKCVTHVVNVFF